MKTLPLLLALGLVGAGCEAKLSVSSQPTEAAPPPILPTEPPPGYLVQCNQNETLYRWVGPEQYVLKESLMFFPERKGAILDAWRAHSNRTGLSAASRWVDTNSWKECQ